MYQGTFSNPFTRLILSEVKTSMGNRPGTPARPAVVFSLMASLVGQLHQRDPKVLSTVEIRENVSLWLAGPLAHLFPAFAIQLK